MNFVFVRKVAAAVIVVYFDFAANWRRLELLLTLLVMCSQRKGLIESVRIFHGQPHFNKYLLLRDESDVSSPDAPFPN